jgi:hypothetical protein
VVIRSWDFSEGQELQMRWQPFRSRKLLVRKKGVMDQLVSTGAEGGQWTTTQDELKVEIHLLKYKSRGVEGQIVDVALDG